VSIDQPLTRPRPASTADELTTGGIGRPDDEPFERFAPSPGSDRPRLLLRWARISWAVDRVRLVRWAPGPADVTPCRQGAVDEALSFSTRATVRSSPILALGVRWALIERDGRSQLKMCWEPQAGRRQA
jgi:hypothetical protein